MTQKELAYRFELPLDSSPEQLWPLVSDTNRFNRDAGLPALDELGVGDNARRRLPLAAEWGRDRRAVLELCPFRKPTRPSRLRGQTDRAEVGRGVRGCAHPALLSRQRARRRARRQPRAALGSRSALPVR